MVLVVDDIRLSFNSMFYVRRTLRKFIDELMQPGDLVALWETGRNNSVFQQFTSDKRVLAAAVENLQWNPRGLGIGRSVCADAFRPLGQRLFREALLYRGWNREPRGRTNWLTSV